LKILVNDESREMDEQSTVSSLLEELEMSDLRGWAIAVNENVIPTDDLSGQKLFEGDRVILVQATQGG